MTAPAVVLDAKALLLAYVFPGGPCSELLDRAISRHIRGIVSPSILAEFHRILTGPTFTLPESLVSGWVEDIKGICETQTPVDAAGGLGSRLGRVDTEVIACAAAAGADHIVTGERSRLLGLGSYQGITIEDPASFLQALG